jgi:hypothetical protein
MAGFKLEAVCIFCRAMVQASISRCSDLALPLRTGGHCCPLARILNTKAKAGDGENNPHRKRCAFLIDVPHYSGSVLVLIARVILGRFYFPHYYAAQIVLFGAEFTRVYAQERGRGIRPAKHAVRVDRKEIELPPLTDRGDK